MVRAATFAGDRVRFDYAGSGGGGDDVVSLMLMLLLLQRVERDRVMVGMRWQRFV